MANPSLEEINKEIAKLYKQLGKLENTQPFKDVGEATKELARLRRELNAINSELDYFSTSLKNSIQELTKGNYALSLSKSSFKSLVSIADKFLGIQRNNEILSKKEIKNLQDKANLQFRQLEYAAKYGKLSKQEKEEISARVDEQKDYNKALEEGIAIQEEVLGDRSVSIFGALEKVAKSIPIFKAFATPFEEAAKASRDIKFENINSRNASELQVKAAKEQRKLDIEQFNTGKGFNKLLLQRLGIDDKIKIKGDSQWGNLKKMAEAKGVSESDFSKISKPSVASKSTLAGGAKALSGALAKSGALLIIKSFGEEFLKVNKQTVELQKSLALSASEATDLRQGFASAAASSENINISTTALLETITSLSKQFGFPTLFDDATLITTTKLTKQVGISAESAGMLAAATVTTGKNFEDQYKDALGTSYELQRQSGVQLDLRNILEESGKVTGTIRANLGANVETIAAAVTQAKLFGGSLNDVANASKALLDFESSITAELEAELLLGKNINLETARQASLNGDMVTVAKELRKEAGDYTEFSKMNVIQQEALAKAMGMQSDQLADILFQQDIQGKTAGELRALRKDELADRLEAQTAQEKFNASVAKLKGLLGDVVTAFMPFIDILNGAFGILAKLISFFKPVIGSITGALAGFAAGGPIGAGVGLALGAYSDITKADDAIVPTTGYGDTIIKSGKDTIALNNEDSVAVVAGTNLGGGSNKTGERTNQLLESLIMQNSKKPEISPVGLYEVQ
jgi:hypothetical protein